MNYEVFLSDTMSLADKVDTNVMYQLLDTIMTFFNLK